MIVRLFFIVCGLSLAPSVYADWIEAARRLTGESDAVRTRSIRLLRKVPDLEARLKAAMATGDRFLAFDVMVALELKSLVPELIAYSSADSTGYSYHTLNALASGAEMRRVLGIYRARLESIDLRPASKVAILDSLARTSIEVPGWTIDRLLLDAVPEVRESTLGYLRSSIMNRGRAGDIPRVARALLDGTDAIRWRAVSILAEVPLKLRKTAAEKVAPTLTGCREDPDLELRALCLQIAGDYTP